MSVVTMREILDDTMASWTRERPDLDLDAMGTTLRLNQLMNAALRAADACSHRTASPSASSTSSPRCAAAAPALC